MIENKKIFFLLKVIKMKYRYSENIDIKLGER